MNSLCLSLAGGGDSAEDRGWYFCLFPDLVLQADQPLIQTWCSPSDWLEK
jgi:hypothetical protein